MNGRALRLQLPSLMYERDGRHSHSGRSLDVRPRVVTRQRGFEPHGDQPRGGQSGAAIACMWCGAWDCPCVSPFRGWSYQGTR